MSPPAKTPIVFPSRPSSGWIGGAFGLGFGGVAAVVSFNIYLPFTNGANIHHAAPDGVFVRSIGIFSVGNCLAVLLAWTGVVAALSAYRGLPRLTATPERLTLSTVRRETWVGWDSISPFLLRPRVSNQIFPVATAEITGSNCSGNLRNTFVFTLTDTGFVTPLETIVHQLNAQRLASSQPGVVLVATPSDRPADRANDAPISLSRLFIIVGSVYLLGAVAAWLLLAG